MVIQLVLVGSFYATVVILTESFSPASERQFRAHWANVMEGVYAMAILLLLVVSATAPLASSIAFFKVCLVLFGGFMVTVIVFAVFHLLKTMSLAVLFALVFGAGLAISYLLPIIVNFRRTGVCKYIFGSLVLVFMMPTYLNLVIYAICNLHDVTWGSREMVEGQEQVGARSRESTEDNFRGYRTKVLVLWILLNSLIS